MKGENMLGYRERVIATAIIWTALACIMIFGEVDTGNFISLAVLVGGAFLGTSAIWEMKHQPEKSETIVQPTEKAKRTGNNRLARLIESMDEEDIATLEAILASRREQLDEDEQIELNRLLAEQDRARH